MMVVCLAVEKVDQTVLLDEMMVVPWELMDCCTTTAREVGGGEGEEE